MADINPKIADLRSTITLTKLTSTSTLGIATPAKTQTVIGTVRAMIVPLKASDYIGVTQIDLDIKNPTHYAVIRTQHALDINDEATRNVYLADGSTITETYRVLGTSFVDQQRRFTRVELKILSTVLVGTN